ncbi:MAG: hypothetical protein IT581_11605 [Verrucomicrobiales bacterium]|nr:hypothetical protein [Verrucomicrobiales bacterium]
MKSSRAVSFLVLFALAAVPVVGGEKRSAPEAVGGWADAIILESRSEGVRAVVVPSVGGRVVSYGKRGENILWQNPNASSGGDASDPGGFQCDIGPMVSGLKPHASLWSAPYTSSRRKNQALVMKSAEDKVLELELEKDVVLDPATGDLGFVHRIKNLSDRSQAYCLWHRIACRPGGFVMAQLNKKSRFAAGWSMLRETNGKLSYDGKQPESAAVKLLDGVLVAQTGPNGARIGLDTGAQWVAYALGRTLFVVHFPVYSVATYSEGGNSVTVAWDDTKTEIAPHSPEARMASRKSYEFPLKWTWIDLPSEVTTHEQARALVDKIPGSPFE